MTETPAAEQSPETSETTALRVPDKPALEGLEAKWSQAWKEQDTYAFDRTQPRENVYSIDTPPPTVSGSLHVGHVFSYTHTDVVARYQRMQGKSVFYPMGWDDNGLPTERRVQNYYGVRCDPSLPYDPDFTPPAKPDPKKQVPISRPNFIELCATLVEEDEKVFESLWRTLGLSVDWSQQYTTIGTGAQTVSQRAFLRNLVRQGQEQGVFLASVDAEAVAAAYTSSVLGAEIQFYQDHERFRFSEAIGLFLDLLIGSISAEEVKPK